MDDRRPKKGEPPPDKRTGDVATTKGPHKRPETRKPDSDKRTIYR